MQTQAEQPQQSKPSTHKSRLAIIIAVLIGISLTVGLILYALRQNIDLFYTPTEVLYGKNGDPSTIPDVTQRIRVGGMVVKGSVKRDPQSLKVIFQINDVDEPIEVQYEGILPDLFREGQGIVAQGILIAPNVLQADEVLAKHDENYVPPDLAEKLNQTHDQYGIKAENLKAEPINTKENPPSKN